MDYHVDFELHHYSVPYQLVHQEVWIRATEFMITVHCKGACVATHARSRIPYRYTTLKEHMPPAHRAMKERNTIAFVEWSESIGPGTKNFVASLFAIVSHEQQAYRTILGLQRLAKSYSAEALERAAAEAVGAGALSCSAVRGIIARHYAERLKKTPVLVTTHAKFAGPENLSLTY